VPQEDIGTTPDGAAQDRTVQIKARADAATPGPWTWGDDDDSSPVVVAGDADPGPTIAYAFEQADRVFIAAARDDIPWLLAENERLAAENAVLGDVAVAYAAGYGDVDMARDALADMEPDGDWPDAARRLLDRTAPAGDPTDRAENAFLREVVAAYSRNWLGAGLAADALAALAPVAEDGAVAAVLARIHGEPATGGGDGGE